MIKYYFGQICKWIGILFLPGFIWDLGSRFFFNNALPNPFSIFFHMTKMRLSDVPAIYFSLSLPLSPLFLAFYLVIRKSIYDKHWEEAYRKQRRGRYSKDRSLWDDSNWDKP